MAPSVQMSLIKIQPTEENVNKTIKVIRKRLTDIAIV